MAGEPVKPTAMPRGGGPIAASVRIPLIKTAPGELCYDVVLKYGGRMPALGTLGHVEFPLIHCENIRPDLSQVRLYVPDRYRWFDFGGTMRLVAGGGRSAGRLRQIPEPSRPSRSWPPCGKATHTPNSAPRSTSRPNRRTCSSSSKR